jgi:nucleotide-binding universal stress UspA family protein
VAIKDILVHSESDSTNGVRCAAQLAQAHGARLTGLYIIPELIIPMYAEINLPADILEQQEKAAQEQASKAEAEFKSIAAEVGCLAEWHCARGYAERQLLAHARNTDLVIMGQAEESGMLSAQADLDDQIILAAGRPVLMIPYIGVKGSIGRKVLVAWNGTRESTRAVNDALPILQKADRVEVLAVNPQASQGELPTVDICLHLARHGVRAEASQTVAKDLDVGDVLLSRAADQGIDLIVMGAYGHSRLRETVLGGATRHLLAHMTVPVLLSH